MLAAASRATARRVGLILWAFRRPRISGPTRTQTTPTRPLQSVEEVPRYLLKYKFRSLYTLRKNGSCKSGMNRMPSPVDFISGPNSLLTSGNFS